MTEQHERYANELEKAFNKFNENVNKILEEMFSFESKTEKDWEMKCPYEYGDKHYCLQSSGDVFSDCWHGIEADDEYFSQGNIFPTKEAAELESKRRNLLTRFRAFRDECNGDWKADWRVSKEIKAYIQYHARFKKFVIKYTLNCDIFQTFGFFKREQDAKRAIELFGDELKELFVEGEV